MMKKCPDCGGPVEQMISAPAVQFKGSGWYVTDYAKKSGVSSSEGGGKESKKEEKSKSEATSKEGSAKDGASGEAAKKDTSSKKSDKHK